MSTTLEYYGRLPATRAPSSPTFSPGESACFGFLSIASSSVHPAPKSDRVLSRALVGRLRAHTLASATERHKPEESARTPRPISRKPQWKFREYENRSAVPGLVPSLPTDQGKEDMKEKPLVLNPVIPVE